MLNEELKTLKLYIKGWKMWNSWLRACERPEVEFEEFINAGFTLTEDRYGVVHIIGTDNGYDVEMYHEMIHISFKGKPRYTWYPYVISYGNLPKDEDHEDPDCRFGVRTRLELTKLDRGCETT